ncbi:MAG: sugar-binding domain-containing protein [Silvibacterium sp.]
MLVHSRRLWITLILFWVSIPSFASEVALHDGWTLQSACKLSAAGAVISTPAFHPEGWITASVPSTVLAAQVAAGEVKQPYYGMNLRKIPGTSYPLGEDFSNLPMSQDSPYHCGWWYRKAFRVPAADRGKTFWLNFGGINYSADIWVNGKQIAARSQVAGAYRTYEFDVTDSVVPGTENVVAVETFAPTETDLGINWVDWNPAPPDKDMGLWGPVSLVTSGPVSVRSPMAATHLPDDSLKEADLTVYGELRNATAHAVHGIVAASVANVRVEQPVDLAPHEDRAVAFTPEQFPQLRIRDPQLWWPWQMGQPTLETLTLSFTSDGQLSDQQSVHFGIREVTSELNDKGHRLFRINGKPILVRGGGWSQDMLLRQDPAKLRDQFRMVRDLRLNTIRLEGKMETEDFFHLADENGILVMLGWCCCDHW